jgi:hypothetical protein
MSTRNVRPFVHLRVLSSYSLGHGLSTPADVCRHARRVGFDAVALTDVGGTHGLVEFHRAAREVGIKPIYGTLLVLDWSNTPAISDPVQTLIVLALDRTGLRNVCAAATLSATRRERGELLTTADIETLSDGVVAIAGSRHRRRPLPSSLPGLYAHYRTSSSSIATPSRREERRAGTPLSRRRRDRCAPGVMQTCFVGPARQQSSTCGECYYVPSPAQRPPCGDVGVDYGMRTAAEMSGATAPEAHRTRPLIAVCSPTSWNS